MLHQTSNRIALAAAALGVGLTAGRAAADIVDPSFFGQPNTTTQTWNGFSSPAGPNAPQTYANPAGVANWFDRTAATDGAFLIGNAPNGRVYSFSGVVHPQVDLSVPTDPSLFLTTIVLQTRVSGSPLDTTSFLAVGDGGGAGVAPTSVSFTSTPASMGATFDYTVTWSNLAAASAYALTYSAASSSSSQAIARVDTLSAVPEPASLAAVAGTSLFMLARRRRRD